MASRPSVMSGGGVGVGVARQSMYPQPSSSSAASSVSSIYSGPSISSASQARVIAKQAELEGLRALKDQSAKMVKELERLAEKADIMADGGDSIASVMSAWQGVFRAIQIARSSSVFMNGGSQNADQQDDNEAEDQQEEDDLYDYGSGPTTKPALIDTMVRIPVDLDATVAQNQDPDSSANASR